MIPTHLASAVMCAIEVYSYLESLFFSLDLNALGKEFLQSIGDKVFLIAARGISLIPADERPR